MPGKPFDYGRKRRFSGSSENGAPLLRELPSWLGLGVGLLSLATGLLALLLPLKHSPVAPVLLVGAAVSALAGGWILFIRTFNLLKSAAQQRLEARGEYEFKERGHDLRYVEEVVAHGRAEIGPAHPDEATVMKRVGEYPEALRVYVREWDDGRTSFCGYLLLYPLTEALGKAILAKQIRSEAEFGREPLSHDSAAPYLYVGMVLGTDPHARSHVKGKLRAELIRILSARKADRVFARPGTSRGLSLMKSYGFTPIDDPNGVWMTSGKQLLRRLLAEEAMSTVMVADADTEIDLARRPGAPG